MAVVLFTALAAGAGQPPKGGPPAPPVPPPPAAIMTVVNVDGTALSGAFTLEVSAVEQAEVTRLTPAQATGTPSPPMSRNDLRAIEPPRSARAWSRPSQRSWAPNGVELHSRPDAPSAWQIDAPTGPVSPASSGQIPKWGDYRSGNGRRPSRDAGEARAQEAGQRTVVHESTQQVLYASHVQALAERAGANQADHAIRDRSAPPGPDAPADALPADSSPGNDEPRPVTYRPGKLPPGLPDWFVQLDTDRDGQVGLYEWKESGRPLAEFAAIDRNDDGLITAEELLAYLSRQPRDRGIGPTAGPANNR